MQPPPSHQAVPPYNYRNLITLNHIFLPRPEVNTYQRINLKSINSTQSQKKHHKKFSIRKEVEAHIRKAKWDENVTLATKLTDQRLERTNKKAEKQ